MYPSDPSLKLGRSIAVGETPDLLTGSRTPRTIEIVNLTDSLTRSGATIRIIVILDIADSLASGRGAI